MDPSKASMFYVPFYSALHLVGGASTDHTGTGIDTALLEHVRNTLPYWNKTQGQDHIITMSRPSVFALSTKGRPNGFEGALARKSYSTTSHILTDMIFGNILYDLGDSLFMHNMIKLVVEEDHERDATDRIYSVPYPSVWHYQQQQNSDSNSNSQNSNNNQNNNQRAPWRRRVHERIRRVSFIGGLQRGPKTGNGGLR